MINTDIIVKSNAFRLVKPREVIEKTLAHELRDGYVAVEPTLGSICHADLRYFTGQRRPEALARKLPMALIHEGIGRIAHSCSAKLAEGTRVVVVPNVPGYMLDGATPDQCCPACRGGVGENYCNRGRFLGSGTDGIAQSRLVIPAGCAIPIPDEVADEIAVLAELCSVSHQAISRVAGRLGRARVAVFGDGPVGYLTAAVLHHVFKVGTDRLTVFGAIPDKLAQFTFAQRESVLDYDFAAAAPSYDVVVECTGGKFSESAVNQGIDVLDRGGNLLLMGVTEERVPINTRDVLEKGIILAGSSRSVVSDFAAVIEAMKDLSFQDSLRRLLPDRSVCIRTASDFANAMEEAASHRDWKKVLLEFQW